VPHPFARSALLPVVLLSCARLASAADTPATWDGSANPWSDAAAWNLLTYPDNGSPAGASYAVTITAGDIDLTDLLPTVNTLTWTGGALHANYIGYADSAVTGGQLTVQNTAALSGDLQLNRAFLLLNGTSTIGAAGPTTLTDLPSGSQITNNGSLTIASAASFNGSFFLFNNGALDISAPNAAALATLEIQNNGALTLHSGTAYTLDGNSTGSFSIDAGATLVLSRDANFTAASSFSGAGNIAVTQSGVSVRGAYAITGNTSVIGGDAALRFYAAASTTSLTVTGGFVGGAGSMTVSGPVLLTHGTISFLGGLIANGGITLAPSASTLGGKLTNPLGQTFAFADSSHAATLTLSTSALLTNVGALTAGPGLITATGTPPPTFANTGTFIVNAPNGALTLIDALGTSGATLAFTNTGDVYLNAGRLILAASGASELGGTFHVAAGTSLTLAANYVLTGTLAGDGDLLLTNTLGNDNNGYPIPPHAPTSIAFNGVDSLTGNTTITGLAAAFNANTTLHNLSATSATLAGTGTLTLAGTSSFSNGTLSTAAILVQDSLTLSAISQIDPTLDATALTIASTGSMTISNTVNFIMKNHASIVNNGALTFQNVSVITAGRFGSFLNPGGTITNNGTITLSSPVAISSSITFNNQGTLNITRSGLTLAAYGTDSADSIYNVAPNAILVVGNRPILAGALNNAGLLRVTAGTSTLTLGADLAFTNTGTLAAVSGTTLLAAPQQSDTTGIFNVASAATLHFAADYDFSPLAGPTLTGSGLVIIDAGITLTLPIDSAFAGNIQVDGTLVLTPARDPESVNAIPLFTVLTPAPEPASLLLLTLPASLLLRHRRRSPM
jgi:hypothetical protein